jgi:[protein-PII] uridylyltransferase
MPSLTRRRNSPIEDPSPPPESLRALRRTVAPFDSSGIVDAERLGGDLVAAAAGEDANAAVATVIKAALAQGRAVIEQRFMADRDGTHVLAGTSYLIDTLVKALHRVATERLFRVANPTKGERIAVVAVGGYGRGELAPFSDIDLLFLLPYKHTPHTEQIVEFLYYILWDVGLKVGHATRSIDECIRQSKADFTIRTSILEMRLVAGDAALHQSLEQRFEREVIAGTGIEFVDAKLAERNERHHRMGDSRYVLEPNIKEGKGGLRDLHGLLWIAKYVFRIRGVDDLVRRGILSANEARRFHRDQHFLWTLRCHLHYLTGRPEERLTFELQTEIGRRMGYRDHIGSRGVERCMKHYFLIAKDVGELTRIFIAIVEDDQKRKPLPLWRRMLPGGSAKSVEGFVIDGGRLAAAGENAFTADPINLIRLFHVAQNQRLEIQPKTLRLVTRSLRLIDARFRNNKEANRLFLEILTSWKDPERTLRGMNEAGVLGRFIPDFGRVVAQMQYDMYHVYTVDEHTLFAVGILHKIEFGLLKDELPLATSLVLTIESRRALYVAVLLHDIAKGRGGDHSELGAKVALKLGSRLGLGREEIETASWLVKYHLSMSRTAFKRDIDDHKTVQDFTALVQSPERLKLLLILTVADIRAVGPKVWNGWKGALLRDLYGRAQELMTGSVTADTRDARIARTQDELRQLLPDFTEPEFTQFTQRGYPYYWLSNDTQTLYRHARLMREAERSRAPVSVSNRIDAIREVTEVTVYTADHPGLFSRLAGALTLAGAQIVDARIFTMTNGMALDTFWVQQEDGHAFDRPDRLARLATLFENVLSGKINPAVELKREPPYPSRTQVFTVPPRVLIDNSASTIQTVIEINGRDRPALLFDLTRAISGLGLQIAGAKISTYGEKVVDVFFVKDVFGLKVDHEAKIARIRNELLKVLEDSDAGARQAAGKVTA